MNKTPVLEWEYEGMVMGNTVDRNGNGNGPSSRGKILTDFFVVDLQLGLSSLYISYNTTV